MTKYEFLRWATFPIMPVLVNKVRRDLRGLIKKNRESKSVSILDVGGRKSPYTINLKADVTILDVPQENEIQHKLNLGFSAEWLNEVKTKRTNVSDFIIQDMTKSTLKDESYDAVVSVEVIEHVEEDDLFIENVSKVIKSGGWAYFTTPNGDFIKNEGPNKNPDHIRHYKKEELEVLLKRYFNKVEVYYAVKTGKYRVWGLKSFDLVKPIQTLKSIVGNVVNRIQSKNVDKISQGTAHLIAVGYK